MRRVTPDELRALDFASETHSCVSVDSPYSEIDLATSERLIARGYLYEVHCECGWAHDMLTPIGALARRLARVAT